jgi:uncharacterized protein
MNSAPRGKPSSKFPSNYPSDLIEPNTVQESRNFRGFGPKPTVVVVDSGPLLALFNGSDHWHRQVIDWLTENPQAMLVSTWPVVTEVCAMLARRVHNEAALDFLRWVQQGALTLDNPVPASITTVLQISVRFASLPFDLADASVAETCSRLKIRHILSVDADFDVYRDPAGEALINVLRS